MLPVILVDVGLALILVGLLSLIRPIRLIGVRNRWIALVVLVAGAGVTLFGMTRPAPELYAQGTATKLDEFAPVFQFQEVHRIPVQATRARTFAAIKEVTSGEIPLYRSITWFRRGGVGGPESILNSPPGEPLLAVATRTSFLVLADVPDREIVIGTVVLAPPGVRLAAGATPAAYKELIQGGFAKATMQFVVTDRPQGGCLLTTETRVFATDSVSKKRFGYYWRFIYPGSSVLRMMWLRAIKVRAEAAR